MKYLATIEIKSLTPSAIGGYNPNTHDEIFRITSLRGLVAWWLRAIVSGVAYDKGDINHDKKAIEAQKRIFGSTNRSSRLIIKTKPKNTNEIKNIDTKNIKTLKQLIKHIRLKLLLMGKRESVNEKNSKYEKKKNDIIISKLSDMLRNLDVTICVYSSAKEPNLEEVLGLHAVILSLLLGGLGKGSRRAMGAVKISSVKLSRRVMELLEKEGCKGLLQISQKADENTLKMIIDDARKNMLKMIIGDARKIAEKMLKEGVLGDIQTGELPPFPKIPSLSEKAAEIYVKKLEKLGNISCEDRLSTLNSEVLEKLFLRDARDLGRLPNRLQKTKLTEKKVKQKIVVVSEATALGSYILGLPREAKKPPKDHRCRVVFNTNTTIRSKKKASIVEEVPQERDEQYSGFVKFNDESEEYEHYRRPSPVIVSLLDEQTVVITFLKSSDWPKELQWFTTREKEVETLSINDAYEQVSKYLSNNYQKVWPES
ncbi:MAG: type III-B CRISPR module RAMP protein Cmr1 [Candidatus Jordarchaeales archaeon]